MDSPTNPTQETASQRPSGGPRRRRRRGGGARGNGEAAPRAAERSRPAEGAPREESGGAGDGRRRRSRTSGVSRSRDRDRGRSRGPSQGSRGPRRGGDVDEGFKERERLKRPVGPPPEVDLPRFAELGLSPELLAGIAAMKYETPTPIQEQAIPRALAGRDIVGCAQTGTGKTAAFVVPILQRMEASTVCDGKMAHPSALVVTPTRELCAQIEEVGETLSLYTGRAVVAVFGGVPYEPQAKRVRRGVDLLVATPGRLLDMLRQGDLLLDKVEVLVLDEADRMLDMGFWPDVKRIVAAVPERRQNLFFSATMSKQVLGIIEDTLNEPVFIELGGSSTPVEAIEQRVLPVNHDQKVDLLVEYFRHHDPERTLVFTRTRRRAERLARTLNKAGVTCEAIHGDRTQSQRQKALDGFKSGGIAVLVATDVVARGIDVDNITHVINFDIPTNPEDYVHRIGRTARAGASGVAASLLTAEDVHELKAIERLIGVTLERHDLPGFDYEKRSIPESHLVQPKPGKLVWNGGARRSAMHGIRRRPPRRSGSR